MASIPDALWETEQINHAEGQEQRKRAASLWEAEVLGTAVAARLCEIRQKAAKKGAKAMKEKAMKAKKGAKAMAANALYCKIAKKVGKKAYLVKAVFTAMKEIAVHELTTKGKFTIPMHCVIKKKSHAARPARKMKMFGEEVTVAAKPARCTLKASNIKDSFIDQLIALDGLRRFPCGFSPKPGERCGCGICVRERAAEQ